MFRADVSGSSENRPQDTTVSPGRALLLDALSQRMLRHSPVEEWRAVFLGAAYRSIRFETAELTLLASDAPFAAFSADEAAMLGARLGGRVEPSTGADLLLSFREASAALRAAMMLQRLSTGRKVRTALNTFVCTLACYEFDGIGRRLMVGAEIERGESALEHVVPGTVIVSGETYALLGEGIGDHAPDGLVATELEDETVRQASITLAPHASEAMSTFAGLGMN